VPFVEDISLIPKTHLMVRIAAAALFVVAGSARAAGPNCTVGPTGDYLTIQPAVNDPGCVTIDVSPGLYVGNVTVGRTVTLLGAQDGVAVAGRTAAGAGESTVQGQIQIQAPDVVVDGFSIRNPAVAGPAFGIVVKTAGSGASISFDIIDTIGSTLTTSLGTAQGIYLENGPDDVTIADNRISSIQSDRSAKGVLIGDSLSSDPSLGVLIERNAITDVTSTTRGAYGVQANNGANTAPAATGYTEVEIRDNVIERLTGGGWAHAVGLEGDTPGVVVVGNAIDDVVDTTVTVPPDAIAVFFEENPSFSGGSVNLNNFGDVAAGIAVHPALAGPPVNGECNWWNSASGPGPVGPGTGDLVSANVDFTPWLDAPAPGGSCVGGLIEGCSCEEARNHGQYVSCVNRALKELLRAGVITHQQAQAIHLAAAQSDCGRTD
jgi:hypothetical protein